MYMDLTRTMIGSLPADELLEAVNLDRAADRAFIDGPLSADVLQGIANELAADYYAGEFEDDLDEVVEHVRRRTECAAAGADECYIAPRSDECRWCES